MKNILIEAGINPEFHDEIIELLSYFDKGESFSNGFFYDRINGIEREDNNKIMLAMLKHNMIEPLYLFWCRDCNDEQLELKTQEEYDKCEYIMCEACRTEYDGELAKLQFMQRYKKI